MMSTSSNGRATLARRAVLDQPKVENRAADLILQLMQTSDTSLAIERACCASMEILELDLSVVTMVEDDVHTVVAATCDDVPSRIELGDDFHRLFVHGGVAVVRDTSRLNLTTPLIDTLGLACVVAVPIMVNGRPWGVLTVGSRVQRRAPFQPKIRELMIGISSLIGRLIERDKARGRMAPIDRLIKSNRELERFAYTAAHDLRTPLRAIRGFTDLAMEELATLGPDHDSERADRIRMLMGRCVDNAQRMDDMLQAMLKSAAASGDTDDEIETVDVEEQMRIAVDAALNNCGCPEATVEYGPLPILDLDPHRLQQILQNLADNAVKYRRQDRPLRLTVSACRSLSMLAVGSQAGATIDLLVTDNGQGIDPADRNSAFELFQRHIGSRHHPRNDSSDPTCKLSDPDADKTAAGDDADGSGAGLAIVQRLVEELGGFVRLHDGHDGGIQVRVSLPASMVSESSDARFLAPFKVVSSGSDTNDRSPAIHLTSGQSDGGCEGITTTKPTSAD